MLKLDIPALEIFIEEKNEFISTNPTSILLEHSLISISKWEQKWHKRFLSKTVEKTNEEVLDYIRCMTLTQNVDPNIFEYLPTDLIVKINAYIEDPMTATTIPINRFKSSTGNNGEELSSELIYYYMFKLGIPMDCQKWHLNRLLTLIEVFGVKDSPPNKMTRSELARERTALNQARRAKYHTKG